MRDSGGPGSLVAETLGLAMARRAAEILRRHREMLGLIGDGADSADAADGECSADGVTSADGVASAADEAVFSTVLDAVNECMGRFDARPASDRWCDALFQLLRLAESSTGA